ncbi:MAG: hypothetical protein V2J65_32005 [Desulfobacteraceae bacterium]|jgi:hypothetical protein|nr:hypothetical protein [Desulfobacteraceae bacterium]
MTIEEKVSLTIAIPKSYRDYLRTMAAQQNLRDPGQITSASTIAREIICEYIDNLNRTNASSEAESPIANYSIESNTNHSSKKMEENKNEKRKESCPTTTS